MLAIYRDGITLLSYMKICLILYIQLGSLYEKPYIREISVLKDQVRMGIHNLESSLETKTVFEFLVKFPSAVQ